MGGKVTVDIQVAGSVANVPDRAAIRSWIEAAVMEAAGQQTYDVSVRIVDEDEGRALNKQFRDKDYATNVLSFPSDDSVQHLPPELQGALGDIVICGPVVEREAGEQGKDVAHHWAHMLIHGVLHLLGHDHEIDADARDMEAVEARILGRRGVTDPYIADNA